MEVLNRFESQIIQLIDKHMIVIQAEDSFKQNLLDLVRNYVVAASLDSDLINKIL